MTFGYQNHFRFTYSCRQGLHDHEYNYRKLWHNHSWKRGSRRGMRSASTLRRPVCILQAVTGWTSSSPRLCSFTSCYASKERGIGSSNSSAFDVVLFHRWPPRLCKIPIMALPRNGYTIACQDKGWLTLWRIYLQTQVSQLECSVGRPVRVADGNNDWERWSERHHVIPKQVAEWIDSFPISA